MVTINLAPTSMRRKLFSVRSSQAGGLGRTFERFAGYHPAHLFDYDLCDRQAYKDVKRDAHYGSSVERGLALYAQSLPCADAHRDLRGQSGGPGESAPRPVPALRALSVDPTCEYGLNRSPSFSSGIPQPAQTGGGKGERVIAQSAAGVAPIRAKSAAFI